VCHGVTIANNIGQRKDGSWRSFVMCQDCLHTVIVDAKDRYDYQSGIDAWNAEYHPPRVADYLGVESDGSV